MLTKQAGNPPKVPASLCVVRLRIENGFANAHAPCQAEKPDLQVRPNLKTTSEYLVESTFLPFLRRRREARQA